MDPKKEEGNMLKIIKRNGEEVLFDRQKIIDAVNSATIEVDGKLYETDTAKEIASDIEKRARMESNDLLVLDIKLIKDKEQVGYS